MSKILKSLSLISFLFLNAVGQKRNNVWVFGNHAGINFNNTPPTALDSTSVTNPDLYRYYTTSICDPTGNLLFYTDGVTVWDKKNVVIPRYQGRWPWSLYTVPLICPYSANDSLYYLFGVSSGSYANRLQYLTINMKGNRGLGEIVYPMPSTLSNYFQILLTNASVLLAGTIHCNGKDTWIVSYSGDAFYSFLITEKGIDTVPVISRIPLLLQNYQGNNLKFSASGEKLIFPQKDNSQVIVLSFNKATGVFSNPMQLNIPVNHFLEDAEISPDGSKLYFASYTLEVNGDDGQVEYHYIYQMDLNQATPASIEATMFQLNAVPERVPCNEKRCYNLRRTLQLAPDGIIYINLREQTYPPVATDVYANKIESPNEQGIECEYAKSVFNVERNYKTIKYNYIRSSSYTPKENMIQAEKKPCSDAPVTFSLLFQHIDSVRWDFGDTAAGNNNYSSALTPSHTYPAPGNYNIKAILFSQCFTDTAYRIITITDEPYVKAPSLADTNICTGSNYIVNAVTPGATKYLWENGSTDPIRKISTNGYYQLKISNDCSADTTGFSVKVQPCDCTFFVPTAFTPNSDGLNDWFKPITKCFAKDYRFKIFNRFGQLVFSTSQYGKGWDGSIANIPAGGGAYVWILEYRDPNSNQFYKKSGTVVLIR